MAGKKLKLRGKPSVKFWLLTLTGCQAYTKFYNPSELIAVDDLTVKFKCGVIFRQYIPKKRKSVGIKIYKPCDESGYTYDLRVYLGRLTLHH